MLSLYKSVPAHDGFPSIPSTLVHCFSFVKLPVLTVTLSYHITSYRTAELKTLSLIENLNLSGLFFFSFHAEQG